MILRLAFICGFLAGILGLASCVSRPSGHATVVYQTATVSKPVSCVPSNLSPAPAGLETRESLAAEPEGPRRYARLAADWLARVARMDETEPVVAGCQRAAPPP